jgi:hypothetical protein
MRVIAGIVATVDRSRSVLWLWIPARASLGRDDSGGEARAYFCSFTGTV